MPKEVYGIRSSWGVEAAQLCCFVFEPPQVNLRPILEGRTNHTGFVFPRVCAHTSSHGVLGEPCNAIRTDFNTGFYTGTEMEHEEVRSCRAGSTSALLILRGQTDPMVTQLCVSSRSIVLNMSKNASF